MVNEREFLIAVGPHDRIRHRFITLVGEIADFLVQHETEVDGEYRPVVRYDASHGRPHRDIMAPDGSVAEKEWLPIQWSRKQSFDYAASDLRKNWEMYRDHYLESYG